MAIPVASDPLVEQAGRWLDAGGGDWPEAVTTKTAAKPGRPKGSATRSKDDVMREADEAIRTGMSWREFRQKTQPQRTLDDGEIEALKARFPGCRQ
jgi:hypothetical protein